MGAHFSQGFEYSDTCLTGSINLRMKTMLLFSLLVAAAFAAPEARFSCSECVDEMHKLGWMVKMGAVAIHVCQTGGACDAAKEYTCDECIQGLEWVEAYIEDPIMVAEYVVYLEQNFCLSGGHHDQDKCKRLVVEHFANMHMMAMEKFFIPTEICMNEPVCGADPPTKPPLL